MAESYEKLTPQKPQEGAVDDKARNMVRIFRQLESDRTNIERVWEVIEKFVAPYRGEFFNDVQGESGVDWSNRELYDSTAIMSSQMLAANMHSNLTSPSARWFGLGYRAPQLVADKAAREYIEACAEITYQAIQASNFNLETAELYQDLATFGTGCVIEEELRTAEDDYDGLAFMSAGVKEIYFKDGADGQPIRFFRKLRWTAARLVDKFGADNLPDRVVQAANNGSQDKFDVLFAVWRRQDKPYAPFTVVEATERAYGYNYYLLDLCVSLGQEGGYYEMPAFIPRWRTTSESRWGNSPAMVALPDILTLNELKMLVLKANEKVVDPTIFAEERALLGDLDLGPAGFNVVRRLNAVQPFESAARFDVSAMQEANLRDSIQRMFYIDQLQLKDSPQMTATEAQIRYEMMQRVLGPTLGRLRVDYLDKVVSRSFNILHRAGKLPEPPQQVVDAGAEAVIEYTGPLARAQKLDQSAAIERWMMQLAQMAQAGEEIAEQIASIPNYVEMALFSAEALNVPAKLINSREDVKAKTEKREKQRDERVSAETEQMRAQANATTGGMAG